MFLQGALYYILCSTTKVVGAYCRLQYGPLTEENAELCRVSTKNAMCSKDAQQITSHAGIGGKKGKTGENGGRFGGKWGRLKNVWGNRGKYWRKVWGTGERLKNGLGK